MAGWEMILISNYTYYHYIVYTLQHVLSCELYILQFHSGGRIITVVKKRSLGNYLCGGNYIQTYLIILYVLYYVGNLVQSYIYILKFILYKKNSVHH